MIGRDHVMGTRLAHVARGAGLVTAFAFCFFALARSVRKPLPLRRTLAGRRRSGAGDHACFAP